MSVRVEGFKSVEGAIEYVKGLKDASVLVTIYDKNGKYWFQGEVIFMNRSFFILCGDYNFKDTVLFADLVSGERMVG